MAVPQPSSFAGPPPFGPGSSGPVKNSYEEILVSLHEVERLKDGRASPGSWLLGVKVAITSQREKPILKVEPRRFVILMANGVTARGRFCTTKEPALSSMYLVRGKSIVGWVVFDIPNGAQDLAFLSELTQPPMQLTLPTPADPQD